MRYEKLQQKQSRVRVITTHLKAVRSMNLRATTSVYYRAEAPLTLCLSAAERSGAGGKRGGAARALQAGYAVLLTEMRRQRASMATLAGLHA